MLSRNSGALLAALLTLSACARSAPPLPPDLSHVPVSERLTAEDRRSPEAALACEELATQLSRNLQRVAMLEGTIHSQRDSNQAVGYVGAVLFPPLMVIGTQHAIEEKAELDQLQEHRDRLRRVQASKSCPAS